MKDAVFFFIFHLRMPRINRKGMFYINRLDTITIN